MNFIEALSDLLFFYNLLLTDIGSYPWVILELNCQRNVKSSMSSPALDQKIVPSILCSSYYWYIYGMSDVDACYIRQTTRIQAMSAPKPK